MKPWKNQFPCEGFVKARDKAFRSSELAKAAESEVKPCIIWKSKSALRKFSHAKARFPSRICG